MTTYSTGTVSIGASSTTLTGVGTAWLTAGLRPGDRLLLAGLTVPIAAIVGATEITLARPWPGAAQAAANYDIALVPDDARALAATNQLLQALGGGTLTSLGQIAGGANLMPYWTGAGVMGSTALTAAARGLLDDADAAAMRATLGLVLTSSALDATAGRVTRVGDYGLPLALELTAGQNLNDLTRTGAYFNPTAGNASGNNYPVAAAGSLLHITDGNAGRATQIFSAYNTAATYVRVKGVGGAWVSWRRLDPERGSNANGEYVRFADGTQICTGRRVQTALALGSAFHGGFRASYEVWTFPAAFVAPPEVLAMPLLASAFGAVLNSPSNTSVGFSPTSVTSSAAADRTTSLTAIGRWY